MLSGKRISKLETTPSGKSNCFVLTAYLREVWKGMKNFFKFSNSYTSHSLLPQTQVGQQLQAG